MNPLLSVTVPRLARFPIRYFISNSSLKLSSCLHVTPNLHSINHISSSPRGKVITVPNILTSLRIGVTPLIVSLIIKQDLLSATILTAAIGLTDAADGYIARHFPSQQSIAGSYLDPLADKFFISLISLAMAYSELLPISLVSLFLIRDALLLVGASYLRFISLGRPRSPLGLIFPKEAAIEMKPTKSSKVCRVTSCTSCSMVSQILILNVFRLIAAGTTIYSGFGYAKSFPKFLHEALNISASKKG
ncbi:unnamed protein product [Hydatigera taeniaeformis]|uniref:cardiolipin synthase (CMP-forming) n=1 Tax=Hydatigena taeniaeformis TaxID=6205 RepID=A0A0R3X380_HYDTA|nr:unnamed protein product [Hydatigera taeniaeformis]